nr:hypothetical protein [Tanacetum cinerariifolium]
MFQIKGFGRTSLAEVEAVLEKAGVSKKVWQRDLVLVIDSEKEPAEGSVKIQFADEAMSQLDDLQIGDEVNVAFTIRGVPYPWQGETKHLVVLMGQRTYTIMMWNPHILDLRVPVRNGLGLYRNGGQQYGGGKIAVSKSSFAITLERGAARPDVLHIRRTLFITTAPFTSTERIEAEKKRQRELLSTRAAKKAEVEEQIKNGHVFPYSDLSTCYCFTGQPQELLAFYAKAKTMRFSASLVIDETGAYSEQRVAAEITVHGPRDNDCESILVAKQENIYATPTPIAALISLDYKLVTRHDYLGAGIATGNLPPEDLANRRMERTTSRTNQRFVCGMRYYQGAICLAAPHPDAHLQRDLSSCKGATPRAAATRSERPTHRPQMCPHCGSLTIRHRPTITPHYVCGKCGPGGAGFDQPTAGAYYAKQRTTDHATAMVTAREFLASFNTVAKLREYNYQIQHEATVLSLKATLAYRSLADTATYCKSCAYKADQALIWRKAWIVLLCLLNVIGHRISEEQLVRRLAPLDMVADDSTSGLVFTSELFSEESKISYHQRILLERAYRIGADAVYFKQYSDPNRAPVAQIYIFNFVDKSEDSIAEIHKNVWSSTDVRIYFIITKTEIKIFNSSKPVQIDALGKYHIQPHDIIRLVGEAKEKLDLYSARRFDDGTFWRENTTDFAYNTTAYERLITELKHARKTFLNEVHLEPAIANKLLVLGILIKYLEERVETDDNGVESRVFVKGFFNKEIFGYSSSLVDVIRNGIAHNNKYLISLLKYLGGHFHGEIFLLSQSYINEIANVNLAPLADFLSGEFEHHTKQYVMWRLYSFNYLPIELISSIYEEFLEANESEGIAYTPAYLVNLLVDECMPLNEPKENFKILDPACGSGIFLVSVFKRLVDWWRVDTYEKEGFWIKPSKKELPILKKLLTDNIFGVDIEPESVNLAIFSLSLTLCDILSPAVIWQDLKFDSLTSNINIKDFFHWSLENKNRKFDLIIGNPPFIPYTTPYVTPLNAFCKDEIGTPAPNNQSAVLFAVFSSKLLDEKTGTLCFIMPAGPLLYNQSKPSISFREAFFNKFNIPQIIDFTFLSNSLFKNKGNEKNVAVAALFVQNGVQHDNIIHVVAKKLRTISQRHYFEFDHYDFNVVSKKDAINSKLVWKANLLGGSRVHHLLERLSNQPTLKGYLKNKEKNDNWTFGDGFRKGKPDIEVRKEDIGSEYGQYKEADFLTGKVLVENADFTEYGLEKTSVITDKYFQWPRVAELFSAPILLIKKSIGNNSIPVSIRLSDIAYRNEVIGIHCPENQYEELKAIHDRVRNNALYRFYAFATSPRSGVNRSTQTTLQSDILNIPYPENNEAIELSRAEQAVVDDTLEYWYDFLAKDINIKMLSYASDSQLVSFAMLFCETLNLLFKDEIYYGYVLKNISISNSYAYMEFTFEHKASELRAADIIRVTDQNIVYLLDEKLGTNHRVTRIIKYYDGDSIVLLKPLELREPLQKQKKGHDKRADIGAFLHRADHSPIFVLEAKRLPTPGSGRTKEYVIGVEKNSGGIERFKLALFVSTITLPTATILIALGLIAIVVFLIYNALSDASSEKIKAANTTIATLQKDLERAQGSLAHELSQVSDVRNTNAWLTRQNSQLREDLASSQKRESEARSENTRLMQSNTLLKQDRAADIRETNTKLSNQNAQLKHELALAQKQVASSSGNAKTLVASPDSLAFATQVLKFLKEAVGSLEKVPHHDDEHYQKKYLLDLNTSISVPDNIVDVYHQTVQRLFTYWAPIVQKHLLLESTDKKALSTARQQVATLQTQLSTATRDAAKDADRIKIKLSQELEVVRKEADQAKAALAKHIASDGPAIKSAYDKLKNDVKTLSTAYLTRRQSTFCELSDANDFKYFCLLPYLPTRAQATTEQQLNRERVWRFKDGLNTKEIAYLISIALLRCFTPLQLQNMVLAVIPASTAAKNALRYEKFCSYVSEFTGLTNGFQCISVAQDREALKGSVSANKVANLTYNNASIKGRQILLFDDVMTSGGSFTQNASCLMKNGAATAILRTPAAREATISRAISPKE